MKNEIEERMIGARNELLATVWLLNQGYQVFRNVSAHGPIDIIGLKDGKFEHFDVKMAYRNRDYGPRRIRVTEDQASLGVKIIRVYEDETCDVDDDPITKGSQIDLGRGRCNRCGTEFVINHYLRRTCSKKCAAIKMVAADATA